MWRSILAIVLLPSLVAAQMNAFSVQTTSSGDEPVKAPATLPSEPAQTTATKPVLPKGRASGPTYERFTFYNALRRGRQEGALIRLSPQGFVTSPRSPVSGIVPLRLELQSADGLTVSSFRYPKTQRKTVKFQAKPVPVSWSPETFFKIHADETAALGVHTLHGKLTFQVIDYSGTSVGPVQQMDVQLPITVVEHDAKVQKANWPVTRPPAGLIVLMIVLLPIEIPIAILTLVGCAVSQGSCPD